MFMLIVLRLFGCGLCVKSFPSSSYVCRGGLLMIPGKLSAPAASMMVPLVGGHCSRSLVHPVTRAPSKQLPNNRCTPIARVACSSGLAASKGATWHCQEGGAEAETSGGLENLREGRRKPVAIIPCKQIGESSQWGSLPPPCAGISRLATAQAYPRVLCHIIAEVF